MSEQQPVSGSSRDYGAMAAPPKVAFSVSPTELYNLSESIIESINTINNGLRTLQKYMQQIGGPNDTEMLLRDKIHEIQQTVNGCVSGTARELQRLGTVVRRGERSQKLQVERLTQAFREALDTYSTVQKQVSEKMALHMPRSVRARNDAELLQAQDAIDHDEAELIANQQAQARLIEFETSMLIEREAYMHKIESDVLDVSQILSDLAEMVQTQGQTVETVESHIEATAASVEAGVDELAKAEQHQRSYRKKMLIISIIVAILVIVFIVWIVKAFK